MLWFKKIEGIMPVDAEGIMTFSDVLEAKPTKTPLVYKLLDNEWNRRILAKPYYGWVKYKLGDYVQTTPVKGGPIVANWITGKFEPKEKEV